VINLGTYVCTVTGGGAKEIESFLSALSVMTVYAAAAIGGYAWGLDDLGRAELALFREDFDRVEFFGRRALAKAKERQQYEIENRALFYLLRIYIARGDINAVNACLVRLESSLGIPEFSNSNMLYDLTTAWFYAQIGRRDRIAPWIKSDFEESDLHSLMHGFEILIKVKCHFAEERYPAALATLGNRKNDYHAAGSFLFGKVTVKTMEAVTRYRLRDRDGAFAALEAAYSQAEPLGLFMSFTELGKDMRTIADAYLKRRRHVIPEAALLSIRRNAAVYARRLLTVAASLGAGNSRRMPVENRESRYGAAPLSPRERQVLECLVQGLTREETARNLSISINTVKSALRSLYNKLGAANRADAVRIAAAHLHEK
jgi:LuxR family maltose regulon positive regulatory protein